MHFVGIDFGTTNSSVAVADDRANVRLITFPAREETVSFRSLLYFEQSKTAGGAKKTHSLAGPVAIEHYLGAHEKGRLIQSLKSHLPSRMLTGTEIFGRRHKLEELIARILIDLRKQTEKQLGHPVRRARSLGRPVRFVGSESDADDDFAVSRLREAFAIAGFEEVRFELEPVAAAFAYESTLDHDELILIGDFGGGTSDCLPAAGWPRRDRARTQPE